MTSSTSRPANERSGSGTGRPKPEKQPLWKRLLPILLGVGLVVFLFGFVLPQFIDYDAVFRAIGNVSPEAWALLVIAAGIRFLPEGLIFVAAQPGLSSGQGMQLWLVAETLANVPPGGLDLISRFQMARSWGFSAASSTSATVASWVFAALSKLVLPIFAVLFLAIDRIQEDELDELAIIALVAVVVGTIVVALVLRSPNLATRVGEALGRFVAWVGGIFRRDIETDFVALIRDFRNEAGQVLRTRTHWGLLAGLTARLASYAVFIIAVRAVGIGQDEISWSVVFAAFAAVMALTVIPIFNMPGLTEVVLISVLTAAVGQEFSDEIAASVFVYRILTWLLPIPFGGFAFNKWRDTVRKAGHEDLLEAFEDEPA